MIAPPSCLSYFLTMVARHLLGTLCLATLALAQNSSRPVYELKNQYKGTDFLKSDFWKYETFDDPTHGRVNYVDQPTAENRGLAYGS